MAKKKNPRHDPLLRSEVVPQHILDDLEQFSSNNPTEEALGTGSHFAGESVLSYGGEIVDKIAQGDLFRWNARDEILRALISAHCPNENEAEGRLIAVRDVIIGAQRGPKVHDLPYLFALTGAYVRAELLGEETSLRSLIISIVDQTAWNAMSEAQQESFYRRIKRKFNSNKETLIVDALAFSHPAQKGRWRKLQSIIEDLVELGLADRAVDRSKKMARD